METEASNSALITVGGQNVRCLVDSGASFSLIHKRIFKALRPRPVLQQTNIQLKSASGDIINVSGSALLTLKFSNKLSVQHTFIVSENLSRNMLLGKDFLAEKNCRIYFDLNCIKIQDQFIALANDTEIASIARLKKAVTLRPYTINYLPATVRLSAKHMGDTFETSPTQIGYLQNEPMLQLTGSLFVVGNKPKHTLPVIITNHTDRPFSLKRGCAIATVGKISQINTLSNDTTNTTSHNHTLDTDKINAPPQHVGKIQQLMQSFPDIFSTSEYDIGRYPHKRIAIPTTGEPVRKKQYPIPFAHRPIIKDKVDTMLKAGIIRPSCSPYNNPCILVDKQGGAKRLVVDFRELNKQIKQVSFPIPRINEIMTSLNGARYFSTMDLSNSYHQIEIEPADIHKTAFSTNSGAWEFIRLPFGLNIASAHFQSMISQVISGLEYCSAAYVDDLILWSETLEDHFKLIELIFERLRKNGLKLKASKCHFLKQEIKYLGHIVNSQGIRPDEEKVKAIRELPTPKSVKEVRRLSGSVNFFRHHIKNIAELMLPITNLTKKNVPFKWTQECQNNFQKIIMQLENLPMLNHPNLNIPFHLFCDASDVAIGALLSQSESGELRDEKPLYFLSKKLNNSQKRYSTIMKECLAIRFAVRKLNCYLHGAKFIIFTDHKPLC